MKKSRPKKTGFEYFRTRQQIRKYMGIPAEKKLQWLTEMWRLNREIARSNPTIARIQERLRRHPSGI